MEVIARITEELPTYHHDRCIDFERQIVLETLACKFADLEFLQYMTLSIVMVRRNVVERN